MNKTEFGKVSVGIDGSLDGEVALDWAARFAERHDCDVYPIYAWDFPVGAISPVPSSMALPDESTMIEAARKAADESIARWRAGTEFNAQVHEPQVVYGRSGPALVEHSAGSDLLVVGSRGLGAVKGLILGSISAYVAAHSTCPVAIVPEEFGRRRVETIVVGHDGSKRADSALEWVIDAYPGSTIDLVHVWHIPPVAEPFGMVSDYDIFQESAEALVANALERVEQRVEEAGSKISGRALVGDPRTELNRAASEADLLAIGVQGHHHLLRVFMGSTARALVNHLSGPTMIVPINEHLDG